MNTKKLLAQKLLLFLLLFAFVSCGDDDLEKLILTGISLTDQEKIDLEATLINCDIIY